MRTGRWGGGGRGAQQLLNYQDVRTCFSCQHDFFFGFLRRRWIRRAGWMWNTSTTTWKSTSKSRSPTPTTKCRWGRAPPSPTRAASASGPSPQTSPSAHFPIVNSISFPPLLIFCVIHFLIFFDFFFFLWATGPCKEPEMFPGSFEVTSGGGRRNVTLHWSQMEASCENGERPGYEVVMHSSRSILT